VLEMNELQNKQLMINAMMQAKDQKDALMIYCNKVAESDEVLKKSIESEEKDFDKCWNFIEAKAKEHLKSKSGSVNPMIVFGWAIHYFLETNETLEKETKVKLSKEEKKDNDKPKEDKSKIEKPKSNVEVLSMFDFGVDDV
jgi:hypothetical protein